MDKYHVPATTYEEPHWFTGNVKLRCGDCHKVVYATKDITSYRATQISERTPMYSYLGICGHWHVSRKRK